MFACILVGMILGSKGKQRTKYYAVIRPAGPYSNPKEENEHY